MSALSVAEALSRIVDGVAALPGEDVAIQDAHQRVLEKDLAAILTQPPFDASAMDGYAVQTADVAELPATLEVIGESAAGRGFQGRIERGQTVRIFTGAPLPEGADAIIIQEYTSRDGDTVTITDGTPDPAHIRRKGLDFSSGDIILNAGRMLDARAVTLAAAMGHANVPVRRQPKVGIIATGDELVMPGEPVGADQIICSNPFGLLGLISSAGGRGTFLGIARDTQDDVQRLIRKARDADILITIGGASVGDHDLVAPALEAEGMTLDFWRIAMRPGKPLLFGRLGDQRVLGLPGNPTSSLICGRIFLVPLITALLGNDPLAVTEGAPAQLAEPLQANGPRQHYMRAVMRDVTTSPPTVAALPSQDSSMLTPIANADCLIVREPHAGAQEIADTVVMLKLDF